MEKTKRMTYAELVKKEILAYRGEYLGVVDQAKNGEHIGVVDKAKHGEYFSVIDQVTRKGLIPDVMPVMPVSVAVPTEYGKFTLLRLKDKYGATYQAAMDAEQVDELIDGLLDMRKRMTGKPAPKWRFNKYARKALEDYWKEVDIAQVEAEVNKKLSATGWDFHGRIEIDILPYSVCSYWFEREEQ